MTPIAILLVAVGCVLFVLIAVVKKLLVDEIAGWIPLVNEHLIRASARRLPRDSDRYESEWLGELAEFEERRLSALVFALRIFGGSRAVSVALDETGDSGSSATEDTESQPSTVAKLVNNVGGLFMPMAGHPLSRLTTVRTGGPAEFFARIGSERELLEALVWAQRAGVAVSVVGSGSNLLIADDGVDGLVIKLDRELASISEAGSKLVVGGGARMPAIAARAARAGLTGVEFGVNIPGTVGGAVRLNANAYGGELGAMLEWVDVVSVDGGVQRREPAQLGLTYRRSNLRADEVVARACLALIPAPSEEVKARLQAMRQRRHEVQPQGIRTFGSTFRNPQDPCAQGRNAGLLLAEAGCNGLTVGGARFVKRHANFVENMGTATSADVLAVMAEGRRRVLDLFGVALEPEVQTLGAIRFPW